MPSACSSASAGGVGAALDNGGIGRLEAEGKDVERDVGACLAYYAHDPERYSYLAYRHTVRTAPALDRLTLRRAKCGDVFHAGGDILYAARREPQAVVHRLLGRHGGKVYGIGLHEAIGFFPEGAGAAAQRAV